MPFPHVCTHCGMPMTFPDDQQTLICIACGRTNARPRSSGSCLETLERAHRLRCDGEYALATECYNHVLYQHPDEHAALWGRVLSLYGIEHLTDKKTGKQHILVHFPHVRPFCAQSDFLAACNLAPADVRQQYETDGRFIDDVQRKIREAAQHCIPYDIFLCFKETELDSENKTGDYYLALSLYQQLSRKYRVFFSPVEMNRTAAGANYEAAIYHALDTARMMIVLGTRPEYLTATWPQSEWTRFLEWYDGDHGQSGAEKRLIPLCAGMSREDLPLAFRMRALQAIDWSHMNASEKLQQAVDSFFGKAQPAPVAPPTPAPAAPITPAPATPAPTNPQTPFQKTRTAAESGNFEAQYELAEMYFQGNGISEDKREAVKWYRKAAEQGFARAQNALGYCYRYGEGVKANIEEAVKWYRAAANQGYARAQRNLGLCYAYGRGVPQNHQEAVKWYRKAAEQGYPTAQNNLGKCCQDGVGVAQNAVEAVKWYRKAAEQGLASAQFNLGNCYLNGEGVAVDDQMAVEWFIKAAEQGDVDAQYVLALCYEEGTGTEVNRQEAFRWYEAAAQQGDAAAQFGLSACYERGIGVAVNDDEAAKWCLKAAEHGLAEAQSAMGERCLRGHGVSKVTDMDEAIKWFRKAAEQGDRGAIAALEPLESRKQTNKQDVQKKRKRFLFF